MWAFHMWIKDLVKGYPENGASTGTGVVNAAAAVKSTTVVNGPSVGVAIAFTITGGCPKVI